MRFHDIDLDHQRHIISCKRVNENLQFYCFNASNQNTFGETLSKAELLNRHKQVNKRVRFPEDLLLTTLVLDKPIVVKWDETAQRENSLLLFEYALEGVKPKLKWQWELKPLENISFFKELCIDTMSSAAVLQTQVVILRDLLEKKDVEINQYKKEGAQLRRSTVATKQFDVKAFNDEHLELLQNAATYQTTTNLLQTMQHNAMSTTWQPTVEVMKLDERNLKTEVKPDAENLKMQVKLDELKVVGPKLTPRKKKRKALEFCADHLERKVNQRRLAPQLQYKDSQSQGDEIDEWPVGN